MKERLSRYNNVLTDLKDMISQKERGFETSLEINDQFWEDLDMHKGRIEEQMRQMEEHPKENWDAELQSSDSIYEAARTFIQKYSTRRIEE